MPRRRPKGERFTTTSSGKVDSNRHYGTVRRSLWPPRREPRLTASQQDSRNTHTAVLPYCCLRTARQQGLDVNHKTLKKSPELPRRELVTIAESRAKHLARAWNAAQVGYSPPPDWPQAYPRTFRSKRPPPRPQRNPTQPCSMRPALLNIRDRGIRDTRSCRHRPDVQSSRERPRLSWR